MDSGEGQLGVAKLFDMGDQIIHGVQGELAAVGGDQDFHACLQCGRIICTYSILDIGQRHGFAPDQVPQPATHASPAHLAGGEVLHDFFGAAADHHDLDLAIDTLDTSAAHEAGTPQDLHRLVGAKLHRLGRAILEHRQLRGVALALLHAPGGVIQVGGRGIDLHLHVDQLVADHLAVDQRFAEGVAFARPGHRIFQAGARRAQRSGGHGQALHVEVGHDGLESAAFRADQVGHRHTHVFEVQRGGIGSPPAHFLQRRARETRPIALDQQQRHAARSRAAGAHRHRIEIGAHARGDEHFRAVHDVLVAVEARRGLDCRHVRAAGGLGDRQSADLVAGEYRWQHARLQLGTAKPGNRRRADAVRKQAGEQAAATGLRDLLGEDHVEKRVGLDTAELLGKPEAEQADGGCLLVQLARKGLGLVPLVDMRRNLFTHEAPHRVAKRLVLRRQVRRRRIAHL